MKKRNPLLVYLLIWLTAGCYLFYWFYFQMKTLNQLNNKKVFTINRIGMEFFILVLTCAILTQIPMPESIFWMNALIFVVMMVVFMYLFFVLTLVYKMCRVIYSLEESYEIKPKIYGVLWTLLFLFYFISIPFIQLHINHLIKKVE